jgi:hypothetical protein
MANVSLDNGINEVLRCVQRYNAIASGAQTERRGDADASEGLA